MRSMRLFVCASMMLGTAPSVAAQSLAGGTVQGRVADSAGQPVFDATVTLVSATAGFARYARTSRDGEFIFRFAQPGEYEVLIEKVGFHPVVIRGVEVNPGNHARVDAPLAAAPAGEAELRELLYQGTGARPSDHFAISEFILREMPETGRELTSLGRYATVFGEHLGGLGVPGRWAAIRVDGFPVSPLPGVVPAASPMANLPVSWISQAMFLPDGADVGWGGSPGAYVDARTREFHASAAGTWSGNALASSSQFDPGSLPHSALDARFFAAGPILRDTASFAVGLEVRRANAPVSPLWLPGSWAPAVVEAAENAGIDPAGIVAPRQIRDDNLGLFARVDWQLSGNHALRVSGAWARRQGPVAGTWAAAALDDATATDIVAGAALTSEFGGRFAQQLLVSIDRADRSVDAGPNSGAAPSVTLLDEGITIGAYPPGLSGARHSGIHVEQVTRLLGASGHVEGGIQAGFHTYEQQFPKGDAGERFHGDAIQWIAGIGAETRLDGGTRSAQWNATTVGAFVQANWRAAPGIELEAGIRFDVETMPVDGVRHDEDWRRRTGLSNADVPSAVTAWSPRASLRWDIGMQGIWFAHANAGVHTGRVDPLVIGEWLAGAGTTTVIRTVGALGSDTGDAPAVAHQGDRLTLLGPEFTAPRAIAAGAGISRRIGPGWFVGVSAEIRRTDFLPRRYDLNLLPQPVASDQHGRAVHGSLIRHGSLVAVEPGTNRRFSDFDAVSAVNADGRSEYRGVTLSAQGTPAPGVDLAASYTYSRTLDDWPAGGAFVPDAQLPPLPGADGGPDWRYGTSDFDIPHRFVATAALRLPLPFEVRIAGAYSYRSGVPFTPGFRPGVDANGDGSARNDPAFVDDRIDGIGALLGRWPCLADQAGTFAERNSCRGPAIHGMDARLSATVVANDRYRIALTLDAVNLVESVSTELDAALYLVDPDNPLVSNPAAGTVALPLATNPDFGEPLARRTSGRAFRIGFRLDY